MVEFFQLNVDFFFFYIQGYLCLAKTQYSALRKVLFLKKRFFIDPQARMLKRVLEIQIDFTK